MIMAAFSKQAKKEGWTKEEIDEAMKEAKSGDYDHLLQTFIGVCEPETNEEDEDYIDNDMYDDEY